MKVTSLFISFCSIHVQQFIGYIYSFLILVGLAETSPFNPLKVLHSLLEPSYPATGPTVSVIGISNWRLDISKSSRALLVQRYILKIYKNCKLVNY